MKTNAFYLAFLIILIAAGCKTENPVANTKPHILDSIEIVTDTATYYLGYCIDPAMLYEKYNYCILRDSTEYLKFLDTISFRNSHNHPCDTFSFPAVEFNKYSLVGFYISYPGYEYINFRSNKTIFKYNYEKKFKYRIIDTVYPGPIAFYKYHWLLIPKVPDDWRVEFDTTVVYMP